MEPIHCHRRQHADSAHPVQVNNIYTHPHHHTPPNFPSYNHPGVPAANPAPHHTRDPRRRLTTVLLPTRRFHVPHPLLTHLLPRAAAAPLAGPFSPLDFLGTSTLTRFPPPLFPDPRPHVMAALTLLFEGLERMSRGGEEHGLFDSLELGLGGARDRRGVAGETFRVAFALCVVLDMGAGLGCADELAVHVGRFLLELLPRVEGNEACAVVLGYAKVFRPTEECMEVLGTLWDGLDGGERRFVVGALRDGVVRGGVDSNAHRMWRALGELGVLRGGPGL